jgi:spore coat polysaccharide biosynthesis protein SpsF
MDSSLNIVTLIQARSGSTRFPKKILMPLCGKTIIQRMIERVLEAKLAGTIVVITTTDSSDDIIENICNENRINIYRGHPTDLVDRHFKAALEYNADSVVKIPSDCPLIDPGVIDRVLKYYSDNSGTYDYVSNLHPATYPDGNDVEIMSMSSLKIAWENAAKDFEREHTTPYIWENPDKFRIGNVEWETGLDYSMSHRFTIDYMEDYLFIKAVYDELYPSNPEFSLNDILELLEQKPEIKKLNEKYIGVNWYRNHLNELTTVTKDQTKII